ncbi:MAG TPA: phosphoribosylformylglycinamidine synthase subunit PurS [Thermoanaerobaculia bacterium]|nr:phosphoribosylformylglycinamidine synthase subunit PurS [Thermoanaerobaculia bacterium]
MTDSTETVTGAAEPRAGGGAHRFAARVRVMPRPEILDPQGKAIGSALARLGFAEVEEVRAGKCFDLVLRADDRASAERRLERMCDQLLANPIIEDYRCEILETLDEPTGAATP